MERREFLAAGAAAGVALAVGVEQPVRWGIWNPVLENWFPVRWDRIEGKWEENSSEDLQLVQSRAHYERNCGSGHPYVVREYDPSMGQNPKRWCWEEGKLVLRAG